MQPRMGVIDLGTNTFHLLIAEPTGQGGAFREVYRERQFIKLAEAGIEQISPAAFERGLQALKNFRQQLDEYGVTQVQAIGTAALRTASNGQDFIQRVKMLTDLDITLIDGDREAELIYKGVAQVVPFDAAPVLIMDIGGGSVEFIIANEQQLFCKCSFPVGVAILYKQFHRHEPILPSEIAAVHYYLTEALLPLAEALATHTVTRLVGASGTFDVLENMLVRDKIQPHYAYFPANALNGVYEKIVGATAIERFHMPGVPPERADMIVVALLLIEHVLRMAPIVQIDISAFALKEGVLAEMLQKIVS
jgi:exopolyphosphatase/guanosine-5'-triphosphate,3'-diphosphate pyrophosphatase